MSHRPARDRWLIPLLAPLVGAPAIAAAGEPASWWEWAVGRGLASDAQVAALVARRFGLRVADLAAVSLRARELVPEAVARRHGLLPLQATDAVLEVATSDPRDVEAEQAAAFAAGRRVRFVVAAPAAIRARLDDVYRPESLVERILDGVAERYSVEAIPEGTDDAGGTAAQASDRPVIRLVDHIVAESVAARASDIHVEPGEGGVLVRHRVDGVLRELMRLPRGVAVPLASRIKVMAGLDISDRLRPQDGRARVAVDGSPVDLRVSTLPAAHGEKVVVRLLDPRATLLSLDALGLAVDERQVLDRLLATREGLVLVTGPTGSGKTTTLYSALRRVQGAGVNVVTVEDPVEYRLGGVTQVQVNERAGLGFAPALRAILRQDPDVVLVGEVRDRETAAVALQAALTGHLVLSTLHTLDAPSTVTRLLDLGAMAHAVAPALKGVVAQRLVRRLCAQCRRPRRAPPTELAAWLPDGSPGCDPVGCPACGGAGYRGRLAVVELLEVTPAVERAIAAGASAATVARLACRAGMRRLWQSGLLRVAAGETSAGELLRVLQPPAQRPTSGVARGAGASEPRRLLPAARPGDAARAARVAEPRVAAPAAGG